MHSCYGIVAIGPAPCGGSADIVLLSVGFKGAQQPPQGDTLVPEVDAVLLFLCCFVSCAPLVNGLAGADVYVHGGEPGLQGKQ